MPSTPNPADDMHVTHADAWASGAFVAAIIQNATPFRTTRMTPNEARAFADMLRAAADAAESGQGDTPAAAPTNGKRGLTVRWTYGWPSPDEARRAQAIADECETDQEFRERLDNDGGDWPTLSHRVIAGIKTEKR